MPGATTSVRLDRLVSGESVGLGLLLRMGWRWRLYDGGLYRARLRNADKSVSEADSLLQFLSSLEFLLELLINTFVACAIRVER